MIKPLIVKGLTKSYGTIRAVDGLDLEVNKGEIFGLLGHNGAGKSTSIECILGVRKFDAGTVKLLGMNPSADRKKLFEKVGVQFQQTNYHDKIRVSEICQITESLYKAPADWRKLLKSFGLSGMEKRIVSELSGGERQRLSVLLAFMYHRYAARCQSSDQMAYLFFNQAERNPSRIFNLFRCIIHS